MITFAGARAAHGHPPTGEDSVTAQRPRWTTRLADGLHGWARSAPVQWLVDGVCSHPYGMLQSAVGLYLVWEFIRHTHAASSTDVQMVQGGVAVMGVGVVLVRAWQLPNQSTTGTVWFGFFLRCALAITFPIWALGEGGSALYALMLSYPRQAMDLGWAFILVVAVKRWLSPPPERAIPYAGQAGWLGTWLSVDRVQRKRALYVTAIHEAGHAMVYAALASTPAAYEININEKPDAQDRLGWVIMQHQALADRGADTIEWQMLAALAGAVAEKRCTQQPVCGAQRDYDKWLQLARDYLGNQLRGVYYLNAESQQEEFRNHAMIEALLEEQRARLEVFFEINHEVLQELARVIFVGRRVSYARARPYLDRVQFPPGFPRPPNSVAPA